MGWAIFRSTPAVPRAETPLPRGWLVVTVFLPFVFGYFLSYYFRAVNAVLSSRLMADLGLDATSIGIITSAYFLMAAAAQIPVGLALDRWGPRAVQVPSLLLAAEGAMLLSVSDGFASFFAGRALVGIGVAGALMAGLKAIVLWFPRDRIALVNGLFIAFGSTGVLAASLPTELALGSISWRQLFQILAILCVLSSAAIALLAPRGDGAGTTRRQQSNGGIWAIYRDARFWRLAPLSAFTIGSAWALQGLWAAPWLRDVAHLPQVEVSWHLLVMAVALSSAALGFGIIVDRLKHRGVETAAILGVAASLFVMAEIALALAWPVSPAVPWSLIGAFGAGTVLSYSLTAEWFDTTTIGRANGALNVLHFGFAFLFQGAFGWIVSLWSPDAAGHYPSEAYAYALLLTAACQLMALLWFVGPVPDARRPEPVASLVQASRRGRWRAAIAVVSIGLLGLTAHEAWQRDAARQLAARWHKLPGTAQGSTSFRGFEGLY